MLVIDAHHDGSSQVRQDLYCRPTAYPTLWRVMLQGYSTGIVDAAKAALHQAGARTLEDVAYVEEAFLVSHTGVCRFTCASRWGRGCGCLLLNPACAWGNGE